MTIHYLKTWPNPFQATHDGVKAYEIREFDRDFKVRDLVVLDEFDTKSKTYTGRRMVRTITYLNPPGQWGLRGETGAFGTRETPETELANLELKSQVELAKSLK